MNYQEGLKQVDKATKMITEANQLIVETVMNAFLFTWQWWTAFAMIVAPWIIWGILRNRESSARLFSAGLLVMVLSEILDTFGVSYGKWAYPVKVVPVATINFSYRLSVLPVFVMLLLQYKPNFNPFIKAVFFGVLGAYVGMPALAKIDLYKKIDWSFTYSFLILTSFYLLAHWFSRSKAFEKVEKK
ncbi:CBO0543 family protein [Neobacillus sp. 3P2-tot-E-2]|uniref:CBO0543 family protein n=1 Tax=Neobacillus sp. 3P2-tot-E-2 TaxID=3132212 RepID=UPI0039A2375D